ncbi:MerR family transcriptional regulator [Alteribacillus sp. HJP-4]|uniref:MerR family transcriptional regulator n=1 Tax=Alteribacillus sp. HJP-4 TaxID=2775394 RepID=UPI0035CCEEBA
MIKKEGKYNIKAISTMLGIQPGTLRAWERRYKIVEPVRNQAGHRLYTDEHVSVLKWLLDKVNKGFTIGQAVDLLEQTNIAEDEAETFFQEDQSNKIAQEILQALLAFKEQKAHEHMNKAFAMFSIEKVAIDILGALLYKVGDMWEKKEVTVAHEHYVTAFLRTKIGNIFHSYPIDGFLPKVVAVAGPDEKHELGLMIFTLFLRRKGFEVIYLGAGIPEEDVVHVIREVDAKLFFTSCTLIENLDGTLTLIDMLLEEFPSLKIGAGGFAFDSMPELQKQSYKSQLVGPAKEVWEQWVQQSMFEKG